MSEIWKDIKGYEGKYQVSNLGRVKSLQYNNSKEEKMMTGYTDKKGYHFVCLCNNGNIKRFPVHRLVALAFVPNPDNKPCVNHLDDNPFCKNDCADNLEWCTVAENNSYGDRLERVSQTLKGKPILEATKQKISEKMKGNNNSGKRIVCVETGEEFRSMSEATRQHGVTCGAIKHAIIYNGISVGYHWAYLNS